MLPRRKRARLKAHMSTRLPAGEYPNVRLILPTQAKTISHICNRTSSRRDSLLFDFQVSEC